MNSTADALFLKLLAIAAIPAAAVLFGLTRLAHDLGSILSNDPSPVAGLCRDAVAYTLSSLAHASYVGLAALAILSGSLGLAAAITTHIRTRGRLKGELAHECETPRRLRRAANALGISRIRLIETDEPRAYTFGYLRPTVGVSRGLLDCLNDLELDALMRHEGAHVRKRDPLRMLVAITVTRALVFAPVIRRVYAALQVAKEVEADRVVVESMGSSVPLVSALIAAGEAPRSGDAIAGFSDSLSARISWLEGEGSQLSPMSTWRATAITLMAVLAVAAGLFVIATGAVDAHVLHICSRAVSAT